MIRCVKMALSEDLWSQGKCHVNVETGFKGQQTEGDSDKNPGTQRTQLYLDVFRTGLQNGASVFRSPSKSHF